jgi:GNAT superfamily N-acetyltransferase
MIEQLEQVCLAVGSVRESDVEQVVEAVNGKIAKLLNAHIVKLYWRQEAEGGGVILRPVSFINDSNGPDPQHFPITQDRPGVLEWVFRTGRPLWLEQIRRHHNEETIVNRYDERPLATAELAFAHPPQSDAMVVIPLVERGIVHGLYAAELATTRGLSERVVALMQRIGRPLGTLLYNADVFAYDLRKSNRAISRMLTTVQAFNFDRVMLDQDCRTAFIARPYEDGYLRIQRALERLLEARGIRAKHYEAENGNTSSTRSSARSAMPTSAWPTSRATTSTSSPRSG